MSSLNSYDFDDLELISSLAPDFMEKYRNKRILVAGASGFVGSWIISAIDHMNKNHDTNIKLFGISRGNQKSLTESFPEVKFINADISKHLEIELMPDCIFNAATPSSPGHGGDNPEEVLLASVQGTQNLLELFKGESIRTFINLSSGIVTKRKHEHDLDLSVVKDAYLHGKRESEHLVDSATEKGLVQGQNLRLYAFAGPGISLKDHFAIGNFMNDAIEKRPIFIKGNPETKRSYMYPTDLVTNIFATTVRPHGKTREIGSMNFLTINELAHLVNSVTGNSGIIQSSESGRPDSYFPARDESLIKHQVRLDQAILKWFHWITKN